MALDTAVSGALWRLSSANLMSEAIKWQTSQISIAAVKKMWPSFEKSVMDHFRWQSEDVYKKLALIEGSSKKLEFFQLDLKDIKIQMLTMLDLTTGLEKKNEKAVSLLAKDLSKHIMERIQQEESYLYPLLIRLQEGIYENE